MPGSGSYAPSAMPGFPDSAGVSSIRNTKRMGQSQSLGNPSDGGKCCGFAERVCYQSAREGARRDHPSGFAPSANM